MWVRRTVYLVSLLGCLVFYVFYREWLSWMLMLTVVLLPWFSLVLSLGAMLTVKATLRCPETVRVGVPLRTALEVQCRFPTPPVSCRIRLHNTLTGQRYIGLSGERIPTEHCGMMTISYDRLFVYDYLGLFCRRLRRGESRNVWITPKPVPDVRMPRMAGRAVSAWKPKPGGGFSENHELRLYRPGDDLRQIHWKLAAKTGKLVYREAMEPVQKGYLLTMTLSGKPAVLDKKLGQLLWLSSRLLAGQQVHDVRCLTAGGTVSFTVTDEAALETGLRTLLRSQPAREDRMPGTKDVLWQHHIGGDSHEA